MAAVQKKYGKEMVDIASERTDREIISHSTGSLMLDIALGANRRAGLPEGRIIEIYGKESAGKTTVVLLAIAERQRIEEERAQEEEGYEEKMCVFVDAEHALDFTLAEEYGVDINKLIYINPETAEQAMDVLDALIRTGSIGMACVDSVPALVPSQIEQASFEQQHMAVLARFMAGVMQKFSGVLHKYKTTLVFINQVRDNIGAYSPTGIATTTPGGKSLKYYSSIRMNVNRGETIKAGGEIAGHSMKIRIVKNKIFAPFREAAVNLIYGQGIDRADELFQVALKMGYINQGGAWFTYLDDDTGEIRNFNGTEIRTQGRDKMIELIRSIPMYYGELEDKIRGIERVEADTMSEEEQAEAHEANKIN